MPDSLDNTHTVFRKALLAAPEEARPAPPYHLGGPKPVCPANGQIRIALWCASMFEKKLSAADKKTYRMIVELVKEWLDDGSASYSELSKAGEIERGMEQPLALACLAAAGAASYARGKADLVFSPVSGATTRTVRLLKTNSSVKKFLEELDRRIVTHEAAAAIRERAPTLRKFTAVLWRSSGGKGAARHFLVHIRAKRYGVLTKIGRRWVWFEGTKDDTLGTVPESLLESAVQSVYENER